MKPQLTGVGGFPLFLGFCVYHSITTTSLASLACLVGVGEATHTGHHAENVVVHGVHADLSSAAVAHSVDRHRELEGRLVDTGEVAGTAGLVLLGTERKGVHVDTGAGGAAVVLVGLHAVKVATLTLREAILAVELELGNLHGVLAGALDAAVEDNLGEEVVGGRREDLITLVRAGVKPRRTAEGRTGGDTDAREVGARGAITHSGGDDAGGGTAAEGAASEDVHHDTLRGEVVGVVEGLATVDLIDKVLVGGAVHEAVTLNNPHELLDGVVEVELDLVGGGGDGLRTSELELLNEVLVGLLGEPAALLGVEVDVVDVERGSREGLDGSGGGRGATAELVVDAVDPLLKLHVDAHLVVLEGDQGDREAGVAAEPELEGDVEGLGGGSRAGRARVGELSTRARSIKSIALGVLGEDEVVGVADHVIEGGDGTRILSELGPDLHPVTVLAINALTADLELHNLDEPVADVVEPAEAGEAGRRGGEIHGGENNLHVGAVHQVRIAVDDGSHALVEVSLSVEGDLNGLHGEVGVPLVEDLPEGDLGIAGQVDVLSAVADKLKKTATHVCCALWQESFLTPLRRAKLTVQRAGNTGDKVFRTYLTHRRSPAGHAVPASGT